MNYLDFTLLLLPEIVLLLAALAVIGYGCVKTSNRGSDTSLITAATIIAAIGLVGAIVALVFAPNGRLLDGMLTLDPLTRLFKGVILVMALLATIFLGNHLRLSRQNLTHPAENIALLLFAAVGMLIMVGTEELLVLFLGLELTGIAFYILVGFAQSDVRSTEAALKYFLFGSVSAAFLLFGLSFIYGVTGTTDLVKIGAMLRTGAIEPVLAAGLALTLVGFGFKVTVVPFHLWAPDVYAGAPPPAAALIASGSKVAGFFLLAKVLLVGFPALHGDASWGALALGWAPLIAVLAALSLVVGNLAALAQSSVRRLLAYSGIGHAGLILVTLTAATPDALQAVLFYVIIYGLATLGAFGVVEVVLRHRGGDTMEDFAGLGRDAPLLSICMAFFLASLAGLPPLVGFFGKFQLFSAAMGAGTTAGSAPGMLWLVLLGLFMSALSLYYYLVVVKHMFFVRRTQTLQQPRLSRSDLITCVTLAAALLVLGLFPELLLGPIASALAAAT